MIATTLRCAEGKLLRNIGTCAPSSIHVKVAKGKTFALGNTLGVEIFLTVYIYSRVLDQKQDHTQVVTCMDHLAYNLFTDLVGCAWPMQ